MGAEGCCSGEVTARWRLPVVSPGMGRKAWVIGAAAVAALGVLTRLSTDRATEVLRSEDAELMDVSRVGPAAKWRATYDLAEDTVATVETIAEDGETRALGLAMAIGPELALVPPGESVAGFTIDDRAPPAYSDSFGNRRSDAYRAYVEARRYTIFATSPSVLARAGDDGLYIRYRDRDLPAAYLDQDPTLGVAILIAQLDDGNDDVDDDEEEEEPPLGPFINVDPGTRTERSRTFVILRGDPEEHPSTRGFQMVPAHYGPDRATVEADGEVTAADLGGPVAVGFDQGADPQLVGMMSQVTGADGTVEFLQTKDLLDVAARVAEADADVTDQTPIMGVGGHSAADDAFGEPRALDLTGFVIGTVEDGSGAADAGIVPGDRIVSVGNTPTPLETDFKLAVRRHAVGDTVAVAFVRGDAGPQTVNVVLGQL